MRPVRFDHLIKLKCEPELRTAVEAAAAKDRTTVSEYLRRHIRAAVSQPASPDRFGGQAEMVEAQP